ncbi:MAG: alpha/beta fold hydrolase [Actinomycetia bacterium]|nr:alpha/beta fold hydrolase [Actinomycetes bacterium]MCP5034138.1 alpha/beta fold hydrolase [Actinomycetes bacterium]
MATKTAKKTSTSRNGTGTSNTSRSDAHQTDRELIDAAIDAVTSTIPVGLDASQSLAAATRVARGAALRPTALFKRTASYAMEQAKIAAGVSTIEPDGRDRRFNDEAWTKNPFYRRLGQSYLAWNGEVHALVDDLDLDDKSRLRADFLVNLATEAVAPTNHLLGNPAALKEAVKTSGQSLADGFRHAVHDARENGGMPSMVDTRPFIPGETIAATPGSVVFTSPVLELIQYEPTTEKVHARPLFVVPPQINKFYILDLAPGRSLIEHAVSSGHQVFAISWRNPGPDERSWDLDTYVSAILEATDVALEITGQSDLNLLGVCAGGMTSAAMLGHLAAIGDKRIHSATFLVTVLDWEVPSTMGTLMSSPVIAAATRRSQSVGVLPGEDLSKIFAWLRPNDLVWNYWVNNYLMGKNPPAFDVLAWNGDSTNLPAALHGDFMMLASNNALTEVGAVEVLDTPIDLAKVDCPSYVVGAVTDHITPWQACYETVNLLGGESQFVLSSQGHIQALVNPSGNPKGKYQTNGEGADSSDEWLEGAEEHAGSWWDHWTGWLKGKGGRRLAAPETLGSEAYPTGVAAPGLYVLD